jgi:hypothetical protein
MSTRSSFGVTGFWPSSSQVETWRPASVLGWGAQLNRWAAVNAGHIRRYRRRRRARPTGPDTSRPNEPGATSRHTPRPVARTTADTTSPGTRRAHHAAVEASSTTTSLGRRHTNKTPTTTAATTMAMISTNTWSDSLIVPQPLHDAPPHKARWGRST